MCITISDVLLSLSTGIISSTIVTVLWHNKISKIEQRQIEREKRESYYRMYTNGRDELCAKLELILNELMLEDNKYRNINIQRIIDSVSFPDGYVEALTDEGKETINSIKNFLNELTICAKQEELTDDSWKPYAKSTNDFIIVLLKNHFLFSNYMAIGILTESYRFIGVLWDYAHMNVFYSYLFQLLCSLLLIKELMWVIPNMLVVSRNFRKLE